MNTRPRTPPLNSDADPQRSAEYAGRLASAKSFKEMNQVHKQFADLCQHRTIRQEISAMVHAPKGSPEAKARDKLGIALIVFGLFGVPILFWIVLMIASVLF